MTARTDESPWASLSEVARILGISRNSAKAAIRAGRIGSRQVAGLRHRQYSRRDVDRVSRESVATQ